MKSRTCRRASLFVLALALILAPFVAPAHADEDPAVPGPRDLPPDDAQKVVVKPTPTAATPKVPAVHFDPRDFDFLPLNDIERIKLSRAHPGLAYRLGVLAKRKARITKQHEDRKNKKDDGAKKLRTEIARVQEQMDQMTATAIEATRPYGVTERILELVDRAPEGPYRFERYAHSLVLEVQGLVPAQRELFERVVAEVNSAYFVLSAQRKRLELFGKQSELDRDDARNLRRTVEQQTREMDKRFWRLVDYALDENQRYELKEMLPNKFTKVSNPIEHLYALPGLTPSQGTRVKSVLTEIEAEMAPDQALTKRNRQRLSEKDGLSSEDRKAIQIENQEAGKRLQDITLWFAETLKSVLTEAQYRAYMAIPPRLSPNDRRQRSKQVLEGVPLSQVQQKQLLELQRKYRKMGRDMQKEIADIRRKGSDYGPDSPQMGGMQMEMAGVKAKGQVLQREAMGRIFMEILSPDQVSGWVLGYYGKVR